ncbi:MAG: L-lactate permease, partial [Citricoccus sp.]
MAALPIVLTLGLLPTKLPAWVAPGAGLAAALLIAVTWFGAPWVGLGETFGGGAWTVVEVLAIIGGGVLLSRVMDRTGAQQRIAIWLSAGGGPTVASALLMVTGVVPFMESVTGFGVSLIIGIPLLLALGFPPLRAALLCLLGLTIGPWGSMAPGTLLGAQIAGVPLLDLGLASGVFNIVAFLGGGALAAVVAGRSPCGARTFRVEPTGKVYVRWVTTGLTAGIAQGAVIFLANLLLGTAVAGAVGSLAMAAAWALIISHGRLQPTPWRSLA